MNLRPSGYEPDGYKFPKSYRLVANWLPEMNKGLAEFN